MEYDDYSHWDDYGDTSECDYDEYRPSVKEVKEHYDGDFYCVPVLNYDEFENPSVYLLVASSVW